MRRTSLNVVVKYLIGLSLALIAVSNCFNVLSNSSFFVASPSEASRSEKVRPEPPGLAASSLAGDKLGSGSPLLHDSRLNSTNKLLAHPPAGLRSASMASPFAASLSATKDDNLGVGVTVNPGDTIMYTVTITNTGTVDLTGVNFTDTVDPNTMLVAGSLKVSTIALNDTYHTIGNVQMTIPAPGVIANDLNPGGVGTLTVTKVNATPVLPGMPGTATTTNGSVTMNSDGSFTYTPNAGFAGPSDSFTYELDNGTGKVDSATVTINIAGLIWFVDNSAGPAGDGRSHKPFRNLVGGANPLTGQVANDVIFIYTGSGNYTGGLTLTTSEKVIGQGASQSIETLTGFTTPSGNTVLPTTGGGDPTITGTNITAITLGTDNGLHGFTVGDTGATGTDISGTGFGTLTVRDVSVKGTGRALNLTTGAFDTAVIGSVTGSTFDLIESNGGSGTEGVKLSAVGGKLTTPTTNIVGTTGTGLDVQSSPAGTTFSFGTTTVNKSSSGTGVNLNANSGTFSFSSLAVTTSGGTGVSATGSGTVNVTTGSISATGGPALVVNPTTLGMTFTTVSSTNSGTTGISLTSASGSLTIGTTTITNPGTIGISATSCSATLNFGNTTANQSGGTGVVLGTSGAGNTGTITFGTLNIAPDSGQRGLLAQDNTLTITSSGGAITTTNNTAVEITRSSSTTPLAVSLTSVSANGGPNGILLTNTSGSFTVTGNSNGFCGGQVTGNPPGTPVSITTPPDPADATGGTIQNTTGADGATSGTGIRLSNATNISLTRMRLNNHTNFAIQGTTVNGLTLSNCLIDGINGSTTSPDEGSINITNLLGTSSITSSTVRGGFEDNIHVLNNTGTGTLTITASTIRDNSTSTGNDGVFGQADPGATFTLKVINSVLQRHRGDHVNTTQSGNGVINTVVTGNTMTFNGTIGDPFDPATTAGGSVTLTTGANFTGTSTFNVSNNNITGAKTAPININNTSLSSTLTGIFSGTINSNTIGKAGALDSGSDGDGIDVTANGNANITVNITNNNVRQWELLGINLVPRDGAATMNATVTGNQVGEPFDAINSGQAILFNGGPATTETGNSCVNIGGAGALANSFPGTFTPGITPLRVRQRAVNTVFLPGYGGAATDTTAVNAYLSGRNNGVSTSSTVNSPPGGGFQNTAGGAPCTSGASPTSLGGDKITASSASEPDAVLTDGAQDDKDNVLRVALGEGHNEDNIQKLRQEELMWLVQAAIQRWRDAGIPDEALARLQAVTFEVADLQDGQIADTSGSLIKIDETAAGYGWFYDQTPGEDSEFDVPVLDKERQTTELSPAHGKMDLLTVIMRELGTIYLQDTQRVPKALRPLMENTLSPAVRRMPAFNVPNHSTSRVSPAVGQSVDGKVASTAPSQPKFDSSSSQPKTDPETSMLPFKPAVFNPNADLMPGLYGPSAKRMSFVPSASRVAASPAAAFAGGMISQPLGTIPIGEKVTIMFSVTVNDPVTPNTTKVCNQGKVISNEVPGPTLTDDTDLTLVGATDPTCTPLNVADISVTKIDAPDPVNAGGNITYTVTVTNGGPAVAKNVTLNDPIPPNTTFVSTTTPAGWTRNDATAVGGTGTLMFSKDAPGSMANAESAVFTIVVKVNSNVASAVLITNNATAATTSPNPTANDTGTSQTTVQTSADLMVTKTDSPDPVNAGSNITYTITLTNNGPSDAQNVTLNDAVPTNTTFVSVTTPAGWTRTDSVPSGGTGTISFSKTSVLAAETATWTLIVNVNATAAHNSTITNNAIAASTTTDPTPANNTGTATTTVIAIADLQVTKTDAPDPVLAGNNITYTINFQNNGPATAGSVTVTDGVPANTTFVSASFPAGWSRTDSVVPGGTGNIVFSKASVANGETAVFTIVVKVNSSATSGSSISNSAVAASTNSDPDNSNNTANASTLVNTAADIEIVSKTDAPDPVTAGNNLTYTIMYRNNGPSDAQTVTLTDAVPAGTTLVSVTTPAGWTRTDSVPPGGTGTIAFSKATSTAGETATFTIVVNVSSGTTTNISNTASTATVTTDPDPANNSKTQTTTVNTSADLEIVSKTDAPDPVIAGSNVTYTISYRNNGPSDAQTVTVTDPVPAGTTLVSVTTPAGWTRTDSVPPGGTGTISFSKATSVAGDIATFTIIVNVNTSTTTNISNTASTSSATTDPTPGNNSKTQTTTVNTSADVEIVSKTDAPDPVTAGNNITYTISYRNNGPSDAQTAVVSDVVPTGTTLVSVTTPAGWTRTDAVPPGGTGTISFSRAMSPNGETATFTIIVNVNASTTTNISNTASASSATTDPTPGNNSKTQTTTVNTSADIEIVSKTDAPDPVTAGNNITYTISYRNNGPSDAQTAVVTDTVPTGTTLVSVTTPAGWTRTDSVPPGGTGTISFSRAMSPNGETATFTIVVNVNTSTTTNISNTASASSATTDPTPGNNSKTQTTTVNTSADIEIVSKTDAPDPVTAGNNITYTISYRNNGPSDAQNAVVSDVVPTGTTLVSVTTPAGWTRTDSVPPGGTGTISFSRAMSPSGETATFTIVVNVNSSTTSNISNTASTSSATTDPTPGNNSKTQTTTVNTSADVEIVSKTDAPDPVTAGNNITYTISYRNNGSSDAQNAVVTDTVPAGTTLVSVTTPAGWTRTDSVPAGGTGTISFSRAMSPSGETATFTIVVKVNASTTSNITNTASTSSATTDPTPGNNSKTQTTTVNTSADVEIVSKIDTPDPVVAGSNITYTISYRNNGPSDAQTATVMDAVPANTTLVSVTTPAGWTRTDSVPAGGTGTISFSRATSPSGETATFTIVVKVNVNTPHNTVITNSATTASATADGNPGNNTKTATTTVLAQADLVVTKTDSPDPVCAINNITYTINYSNAGPGDGASTTVTDAVPANTTFVSAAITTGTGWNITTQPSPGGTGNVVFSKATSANGDTAVFTIVVKLNAGVPHGTTITNSATAASTISDPNPGNNTGTASTTVDNIPPVVTCPANIIQSTDPNQCQAVVNYTVPSATDNCACTGGTGVKGGKIIGAACTPTCTPASGSTFQKGTTTVTCTATDTSGNTGSCSFTVTVNDTQAPTITCPANVTKSTDPNQCQAVVTYPDPTKGDNCPGVTASCSPVSGSVFPKGTTTVTCTATDTSGNSTPCTFTVTVNDTQAPTITCPANITIMNPPGGGGTLVNFTATAADNCPGVTITCVPPSGSMFVGCTTVVCTAKDTSNNTAICQFSVCGFDICLQDESNPNNRILFSSTTGDYRFCANGITFTGKGKITPQGSTFTLEHNTVDRRVRATATTAGSPKTGNASVQSPPGTLRCNITDRNTADNTNCTACQ